MGRPRASASDASSARRRPCAARPGTGPLDASMDAALKSLSINTRGLARETRERRESDTMPRCYIYPAREAAASSDRACDRDSRAVPATTQKEGTMTPMHAQRTLATALLAAAAAAGCSEGGRTPAEPADLVIPVFSHPESHERGHFGTHMTGAEETPPRPSRAQGQLNLRLQDDGTALGYKLLVANINDVTQAHIHLAPPGTHPPSPVKPETARSG